MTKISNQYSLTNILTADLANSRLGINNVSPTVALDVTGAGKFSGALTSDDLILTAGTLFGAGNTGFSNRLSDTTLYLQMPATGFNITDNALNTRFILSSAGAATFSSSVTANSTFTLIGANATNNTENAIAQLYDANSNLMGKIVGFRGANGAEGNLRIYTNNTTPTLAMTITSVGYVIINGTTSHNIGTDRGNLTVNGTTSIINLSVNNTNGGYFYHTGTNMLISNVKNGDIRFEANDTEKMRLTAGGNLLIGTTSDNGYKLNVNGQPGANGYTLWTNYSDKRLKENIQPLVNNTILDKINLLNPVTFNYNEASGYDEETRARKVSGFIAQELQEIFPEMVGTLKLNDKEYLDTNLSNLSLYLVKAVQELSAEINLLKQK